ncbi:hypothetical protein L0337_18715 [candidate division KSB1 bacterium]|nr:hypothetical protein [candidate division KSB1 bacterium]
MRKIYFILFGVVLVVLILLVDWREKFDTMIRRKPAVPAPLGHLFQPLPDPAPATVDSLGGMLPEEWAAGELDAAPTASDFSGLGLENDDPVFGLTQPRLPGLAAAPAVRGMPLPAAPTARAAAKGLQARPSFQEMPQQPYLDESRQLLRQAVRNYERISPTASATPGKDRQP